MERVVITGMSVISAAGCSLGQFWNTLLEGRLAYGEIREFKEDSNYRVKIGAKVVDTSWEDNLSETFKTGYGKASRYAVSAALSALEDAGLTVNNLPKGRIGISIGSTMGEIQVEEEITEIRHAKGIEYIPENILACYRTDNISSAVRRAVTTSGPSYNIPTACAAGNYAIMLGKQLIEWDHADIVIAGGVDVFSRVAFSGFQRLLSLAPDLCKPFDRRRKGLVVGEGCGIVILERESHAKAREAKIRGMISGGGLTSDRHHMTAPHPEGDGAIRAMKIALRDAGLQPEDIDYVSAHGTGTNANDKIEVKALKSVFGNEDTPPVSSIKSMIGHAMGAASALEFIASVQMMEHGIILPTINYTEPDPDCCIDCVPNAARRAELNHVMSNSYAFGGQDSSVIIEKG